MSLFWKVLQELEQSAAADAANVPEIQEKKFATFDDELAASLHIDDMSVTEMRALV